MRSAPYVIWTAGELALVCRSFVLNLLAAWLSRLLLDGYHVDGFGAYALVAICIELPTLAWLLGMVAWRRASFALPPSATLIVLVTIVLPLALATTLPGLAVAEWLTPLRIDGLWTYLGAAGITAAITIAARQSRPFKFFRAFLAGDRAEVSPS